MGKALLIATSNIGKAAEYQALLMPAGIPTLTLKEVQVEGKPVEEGTTFEHNALEKARFYSKSSGYAALADDGGIMIDALHGEPGVYSRRWPGYEASDKELVDYTLERLKNVPKEKRGARLVAVLAVVTPQGVERTFEADIKGFITEKPFLPIPHGLPFRAVFMVESLGKVWASLSEEESRAIAHRARLVSQALPYLRTLV